MGQSVVVEGGVKRVGQFIFSKETPNDLILVLLKALQSKKRVRLYYGDRVTGLDWLEEYDTMGYIKFKTSHSGMKSLILVSRKDSTGGNLIPTGAVVKITLDKTVIYQAQNYTLPRFDVVPINEVHGGSAYRAEVRVFKDGAWVVQGKFGSMAKARAYIQFISGIKNTKS